MSWFSKAAKKVSKPFNKAIKSVTKPLSSSLTKISHGNIGGGVSDLTAGAASMGLNIATGGNKKLADSFSGGLLTSLEGAARGNSKDLIRGAVTGTAAVYGGPMAAYMVNSKFASGEGAVSAVATGLTSEGNMGLSDYLNPSNPIGALANSYVTGLATRKPKPLKVASQAAAVSAPAAPSFDYKKVALYGGGALAVIAVLVFALKRK